MGSYRANCSDCYAPMRIGSLLADPVCGRCQNKRKAVIRQQMDDDVALWVKATNPDADDLGTVLSDVVRFCKIHGVVNENGFANLKESTCPCADTSAPSKTIRSVNIHFGIKHKKKGWIMGCTLAPHPTEVESRKSNGEKVNITSHLSHVSCRQCAIRIRRVIGNQ